MKTTSKLRVDIESLPTWTNVDAKTPENHYLNDILQDGFNYLIDQALVASSLDNFMKRVGKIAHYHIYRGGNHVSVHQTDILGHACLERLLLITKR